MYQSVVAVLILASFYRFFNDSMHFCLWVPLHLTPLDYLPILTNIQPAEFLQQGAKCHSLMDSKHLLHQLMVGLITANKERQQFRHLFVPAARKLLNRLSKQWIDYKRVLRYCEDQSELCHFVPRCSTRPLGIGLPRLAVIMI